MDISPDYVRQAKSRLKNILKNNGQLKLPHFSPLQSTELIRLYQENEIPVELLLQKTQFLKLFASQLNRRLAKCSAKPGKAPVKTDDIASALQSLAQKNLLPVLRTDRPSLRTRRPNRKMQIDKSKRNFLHFDM